MSNSNLAHLIDPYYLSFLIKVLICLCLGVVFFTTALLILDKKSQDVKMGRIQLTQTRWTKKIQLVHTYYMDLSVLLRSKEREFLTDPLFGVSLVAVVGSGIFLIFMKQLILALVFPVILLKFLTYVVKLCTRHTIEEIEDQLPSAIDKVIRVSTKNDDIKKILYTTSLDLEEPLKSIFDNLAIKMSSSYKTDTLMDLGNRYNNIWVWSFVFILIGYSTNTSKAETVESLRSLRVLLEAENTNKKNQSRERKYSAALNYTLVAAAFGGFIANLVFNPAGKDFFFSSLVGLICLTGGFSAIFITILLNIKMVRRK